MASDKKDTIKEDKAEEEVEESGGSDKGEEEPEEEAAEESAEEPEEAAAGEPRPGQETMDAMAEIEEGWPRSWIVTTAILVIVAIIIVARLVGQSWKQGPTVPRPGMNAGKVPGKAQVPGKAKAPGKGQVAKMAKGQAPGQDPADPDNKQGNVPGKVPPPNEDQPANPGNEVVLFDLNDLKVEPGSFCVSKDKKLIKLKDQFARNEACMLKPANPDLKWYRVTIGEVAPAGELQFFIQPPAGVDALFASIYTRFPHGGKNQWFGGKMLVGHKTPQLGLAMVIFNPTKKTFTAKKVALTLRDQGKRESGELVLKKELTNLIFTGMGSYCLTTTGKLVKLANEEAKPGPECTFDVTGANQIRMEFKHNSGENRIHFQLKPISSGVPVILESNMIGRPGQETRMDMVEGHLMEEASKVALAFRVDAPPEAKVQISSVTILAKHRPPNAP